MSEVIAEVTEAPKIAVLSGPDLCAGSRAGEPAAVVVASADLEVAADVQTAFSGPSLRLYTNQRSDRRGGGRGAEKRHRDRRGGLPRSGIRKQYARRAHHQRAGGN